MLISRHYSSWLAFLVLVSLLLPRLADAETFIEDGKRHSWLSFSRPAKATPTDQIDYARQLLKDGKTKKAERAFRSLVLTWPSSPEAPLAQWAYARLLDQKGHVEEAFDAYQKLMDTYPGRFPEYDKVLERQFEIARLIMNKRRGMVFFGGFTAPERAIPYLETIIRNGPRSPHAAEAQFLIGEAYRSNSEYELAVVAYMTTIHRYPASPFAEKAALGRTLSLYALAKDSPNDTMAREEAWAGVMIFLRNHPDSTHRDEVVAMRDRLLDEKARAEFEIGRFYDQVVHPPQPEAARMSYQSLVDRFPHSPWSDRARERLAILNQKAPSNVVEN